MFGPHAVCVRFFTNCPLSPPTIKTCISVYCCICWLAAFSNLRWQPKYYFPTKWVLFWKDLKLYSLLQNYLCSVEEIQFYPFQVAYKKVFCTGQLSWKLQGFQWVLAYSLIVRVWAKLAAVRPVNLKKLKSGDILFSDWKNLEILPKRERRSKSWEMWLMFLQN